MTSLTDQERDVLAFEAQWWKRAGGKEQAIADLFGLTPTRYFQLLAALIERPEALEHASVVVGRLRRLRQQRAQQRQRLRPA